MEIKLEEESFKPLRIAMLGQKHALSNEGGIEVVVRELSTRMASMGYQVTCYNRNGHHVSGKEHDGDLRKLKEYKKVRMKTVPTIEMKGLAAVSSSFFATICASFGRYDVVHFHAEGPCAFLWLAKLLGKRCIVTIHGLDWKREKWKNGFGSKYIKFGEKVAVRFADEIIVLSQKDKDYFLETYNRKTVLIPNGVNCPQREEVSLITEKWGLKKDSYLLYLGRIVPEKGLRYLINAYKNVETDKILVIAGGVSDSDDFYDELVELSKDCTDSEGKTKILFTGFVDGKIKAELYSNAYIYVLPSDLEGMPLSLLEAMSYGNCCLTSDIDECTSVVGNRAITFKKGDIEDLKIHLQNCCLNESLVHECKREAADYIRRKYNWNIVVEKTKELYLKSKRTTKEQKKGITEMTYSHQIKGETKRE